MDVTWFAETNVTTSHAPLHHFLQRLATDLPAMGVKPFEIFECVMVSSIDTQNNIFSILLGGVCTLVYTGISGFYIFVRLWYQNSTFPLEFTARHFNRLEPSKSSNVGILLGVNQDIQILQIHVIFCSHPCCLLFWRSGRGCRYQSHHDRAWIQSICLEFYGLLLKFDFSVVGKSFVGT